MNLAKLFAVVFSATILAAQAYAIMPGVPRFGDWYYPFIDYPMYSYARYPDEPVRIHHLMARPCDGAPADRLTHGDLGVRRFALYRAMASATGTLAHPLPADTTAAAARIAASVAATEDAREYLNERLEFRWPGRYCAAAIKVEEYFVGKGTEVEPVLAAEWQLESERRDGGGP
jgi:hypothetical protein